MEAGGIAMSPSRNLTPRQKSVLAAIVRLEESGVAPSIEEIGARAGLSSPSTVHFHLKALEEKGYIERDPNRPRSIRLLPAPERDIYDENVVAVPVIGTIAAGEPIHAFEDYSRSILLARELVGSGEAFILQVKGKSMIEDLIDDGDLVVVRKQSTAENGDIVVALLEREATLKRFYREKDRIRLQPANSAMEPIFTQDLTIQGKVVALLRVHEQKAVSYKY